MRPARRCASSPTSSAGWRACRCSSRRPRARPSSRPTRGCSPRSPTIPWRSRCSPSRAERGRRRRARARTAGSRCRAAVLRRVSRGDRRQPAAAAGAAQDAAGGGRAGPTPAHADAIREVGPARGVAHRAAAAGATAARRRRGGARRRGAGRRRRACPPSRRWPRLDETRVAEAARALAGAEILRAEPPLGFVHPLVRDAVYHDLARGGARAAARARGESARWTSAPRPSWWRRSCSPRRRRGEPWVVALLREAALRGAAPRRDRERGVATCGGRSRSRRRPSSASSCCSSSGWPRAWSTPAAAVAHISQVHDQLVDPQARAQAAAMLARMLLFTGPAQAAATVVRGALADLPAEHAGTRQALEALELYTVAFGAQVAGRRGAARARARRRAPEGAGRQHAQRRRRLGLGAAGRHRTGVLRARARRARPTAG